MNCEPGDLVVIVSSSQTTSYGLVGEISRAAIGMVSRVTHLRPPQSKSCSGALVWAFESPLKVRYVQGKTYTITGATDAVLRPLRDSDKADETLTWASKPTGIAA
jgi:hypothetical protein